MNKNKIKFNNFIFFKNNLNIINLYNLLYFLGIGDWGLGIGDWGLGPIPNPQSPIPNPQSPIPNSFTHFSILKFH
jgi:hypothetical protein